MSVGTQNGVVDPFGRGLQPSGHAGCAIIAIAFLTLAPGLSLPLAPGYPSL
jgi:hypothetical protein